LRRFLGAGGAEFWQYPAGAKEEKDASKIYWLMWAFVAWKIEEDRFE
jgi:hypothetical protein